MNKVSKEYKDLNNNITIQKKDIGNIILIHNYIGCIWFINRTPYSDECYQTKMLIQNYLIVLEKPLHKYWYLFASLSPIKAYIFDNVITYQTIYNSSQVGTANIMSARVLQLPTFNILTSFIKFVLCILLI